MPDLIHSLQGRDLGFLKIVAGLWGVELEAPDAAAARSILVSRLLDADLVREIVAALPQKAQTALADLQWNGGRLPYALFARRYGAIREMGPARRDREKPQLSPASPSEALWYRALIGRAFFDTPTEPQEFAYVPDDLMALLPPLEGQEGPPIGQPAPPEECAHAIPGDDRILDHATTFLAALRAGYPPPEFAGLDAAFSRFLEMLLIAAGLVDENRLPRPEPARVFLEASRGEALASLVQAWRNSPTFNELRLLPGLIFEGEWSNDPLRARKFLLDLITNLPAGMWWNLARLVEAIHERWPDFQRPAGDYDSWFIRDAVSGSYLRGYEHWDAVDGALIRFMICGPLHWLGLTDLASASPETLPAAFRLSSWASALLAGSAPEGLPAEDGRLVVNAEGVLRIQRRFPRSARYQIARFCRWEGQEGGEYRYRITPASLARARRQNLRVSHLITLLRRHSSAPPPPSLVRAIQRWELDGVQARMEPVTVLRLASPEMLAALRRSRAARFLGDPLGPTAVVIQPGARQKVLRALAEMGYLTEDESETKPGV
jgi:hypothetical protein